jgi:dTDP-glucose pyrophosphorylase
MCSQVKKINISVNPKWEFHMLNIVIPMAGAGSRFAKEGYRDPKPLIPVHGVPMIQVVINNLRPSCTHRFIFICQQAHVSEYGLCEKLTTWAPGCSVVEVDGVTEGAACTVLASKSLIDNDVPLMVANSDQFVDTDIEAYLGEIRVRQLDGLIMTMKANDPKWSFVRMDVQRMVTQVVEKQVISDEATVGIYNFSKGCDFVRGAESMISANKRVNGEFYIAPIYNSLIKVGQRIGVYNIGFEGAGMYGLGIPSDLRKFLALPVSQEAIRFAV